MLKMDIRTQTTNMRARNFKNLTFGDY